jgi:hypothetical protein
MPTLSKEYRKQLEKVVLAAREEAESGAAAALESYGVGEARKPAHLDKGGEDLRKKLRAHGRQLGDLRRPDESQELDGLIHETAYEHWHRMLFARFLAENGFLIEPESGLDVDLEYCEERARETNGEKWEIAAGFAQRMLTAIFRPDDPVLQLRLPAESRNRLTGLLAGLPAEVFTASDSLGWVYQFWQAKKKEEVNRAGNKIGADELPSVTQLFTEDYMVDFLLDNTLGAWHVGKLLTAHPKLAEYARSEEELRQVGALPGCPWKYLRFIQDKDGNWTPAAGTFDGWPKTAAVLKALDPCMGSGHFVVAMFERLVALRMAEEGLDEAAAVAAVIRDNLFGLEIDPRCTQIGAFNLALAAWRRVGHCKLPAMNLACSGLAPNTREADWLAIAGDNQKLRAGMERLYRLFQKAAVLGSLINPRAGEGDLLVAAFHELQPLLEKALAQEAQDDTAHEMAVTARGLAKAAEILAGQFTLVATNVPYLAYGAHDPILAAYLERNYSSGKADLATAFTSRCIQFSSQGATIAIVTPQNWLYGDYFEDLRRELLERVRFQLCCLLGPGAFSSISGEVVKPQLLISGVDPSLDENSKVFGLDLNNEKGVEAKAKALLEWRLQSVKQAYLSTAPAAIISFAAQHGGRILDTFVEYSNGIQSGDLPRFSRQFWELGSLTSDWAFQQTTTEESSLVGGLHNVLFWQQGRGVFVQFVAERLGGQNIASWVRGTDFVGRTGIAISPTGQIRAATYGGTLFDDNTIVLVPRNPDHLPALVAFCLSKTYGTAVRSIDKALKVRGALVKVPFDIEHWQKVAAEKYPHGLPKPFSSDATQWLFNGHPAGADQPLHVAVARLLGYQWPRQTGSSFSECPAVGPDGLEKHADEDGVVCFSQVRDEPPAADRLRALLTDAYGAEWSHARERKLIAATGSKVDSLEDWLLNDFFAQHCDLFHNRPFIWHIWDGRKDGFNVLVNYHKLAGLNGEGHRTLETLAYAYLGDWIKRQKDGMARGEAGADDRHAAALELEGQMKKILTGEPPYDVFIRWKPLHQQPIGWEPDINDGVRLNCRPFMAATLTRGKAGAGLFRAKPGASVKWEKDRGKEPVRAREEFPWFWKWNGQTIDFAGNGEFDGNRWNDCHYTTAMKQEARKTKALK